MTSSQQRAMVRLEMPKPPSLWSMYRGYGASKHLSRSYQKWRDVAGLMVNRQIGSRAPIAGPFSAHIALRRDKPTEDIDNRIKPVLDLLQFMGVVANDKFCIRVEAVWDNSLPAECVVIIQEAVESLAA